MAPPRRPEIVIGLDVGKSAHWACVVTREGELLASRPIPNREDAIDGLCAQYPGALVVVDQVRNIGSLALSRAKLAGMPRAYLPRLAAHGAPRLFAGDAKTDERDAMAMAKTALGIPDALPAVAGRPPEIGAARSLAAQRDFLTCESTRSKNRLRSILLESCPEFEAQADLSDPATPQAHGRRRRPVVDIRGLAAVRRGARARPQARQSGGAGRIRRIVKQATPGGRRLRGPRRSAARAKDIGERRRDRVANLRDIRAARRRRDIQVPAHGARHRTANGIRAGHIHRHSRLRGPRQARLALRARAARQAVRHVDIVGVRVAAGQQEAEEPARILLQLPCAQPQPMGRILRALPRQGHAARQGAESRGEEAARGDLRDHGGQGSVRSLTAGGGRRPGRACVSIAKNAHRKGESLLTEL